MPYVESGYVEEGYVSDGPQRVQFIRGATTLAFDSNPLAAQNKSSEMLQ